MFVGPSNGRRERTCAFLSRYILSPSWRLLDADPALRNVRRTQAIAERSVGIPDVVGEADGYGVGDGLGRAEGDAVGVAVGLCGVPRSSGESGESGGG